VMQSVVSPVLATVIKNFGFAPVCVTFALLPIAGYFLVHVLIPNESTTDPAAHHSHATPQSQATLKTASTR